MQIQKPSDLARIVKTQRQAQGLSQQAIADTVGITRQSLARIERGNGGASFDTVIRIFDTLGISLDATPGREHHTIAQGVDAADTAAIAAPLPQQPDPGSPAARRHCLRCSQRSFNLQIYFRRIMSTPCAKSTRRGQVRRS